MKLRTALLALALAAPAFAPGATPAPPERVARLSYVEGGLTFQAATEPASSALPDRPLAPGDRLTTGADGRAELALGTAAIRLDQDTALSLAELDATHVRAELDRGTISVHLHELLEDESFELATPNTAITLQAPGEYRVDVIDDGETEFTVRAGSAEVATAGGPVRVADGQRVRLEGRDALANLAVPQPADAFDDWVLEREVQLAQAEPPAYEMSEDYEDEALDRYGEWYDEPRYGRVWMPSYAYGGYDPFRYGYWQPAGFGWAWYDPMPWSAHTFHYGRWAYLDHLNRWCWVPARRDHRWHVAKDTRPFGRPWNDARPKNDRQDSRSVARSLRDDEERKSAAASSDLPRRLDADRQPVFRRDADSVRKARVATFVPSSNGNSNPPARSASASKGGGTTMRPSKPAESRKATPSRSSMSSNNNREFGTLRTP